MGTTPPPATGSALFRGRARCGWVRLALPCLLGTAALLAPPAVAAPPGVVIETRSLLLERHTLVELYRPEADEPRGGVIIAHGFARSRERHVRLAEALAGAGYVVAVPDLPYLIDREGNSRALRRLAVALDGGVEGLPKALVERTVLVAFSAANYPALIAAASDLPFAGFIGLDPFDRDGYGAERARRVEIPSLVLRAPPDLCNWSGSGAAVAAGLAQSRGDTVIEGASHCDFEDPTDWVCRLLCGRANAGRQARIRSEVLQAVQSFTAGR